MSQAATIGREVLRTARGAPVMATDVAKETSDPRWRALYRVAGAGALLTGLLIPLQVVAFIVWPPPIEGSVADWFAMFQDNWFVGLVSFDLAILVEEVLLVPIALALYVLLRRRSESLMAMAVGLWLVSVALFIGSNTGFEMLSLNQGYATATTEAQRATLVAAGQAMLASYMEQGSAFTVAYLLASVAGIMVGIGMLRSRGFTRIAAYAAIAGNLLGLGLFIPTVGVPLAILSVVVLIAWYLLIGWRLLVLANPGTAPLDARHALQEEA
jgi:hypothetical protein